MKRKSRKSKIGLVISNKMEKTVVVLCERKYIHPKYFKVVKAFSKFFAHDEAKTAKPGDRVLIEEIRPLSKNKHFRVVEVLGRGEKFKRELPKKREKELEVNDTGTEPVTSS